MNLKHFDFGTWIAITEEDLPQRSQEWLDYREKGLGASDAAVIMGASPYKTIKQLWDDKLGQGEPFIMNAAVQNGIDLEPKARHEFEIATGLKVKPLCAIHKKYDWLRASLDGCTEDGKITLEIKCPSFPALHNKIIRTGQVPTYYYPQVQYQLLVTSPTSKVGLYWTYMKSMGGFIVEIPPNKTYQKELFSRAQKLWNHVISKTEPDPRDFLEYLP